MAGAEVAVDDRAPVFALSFDVEEFDLPLEFDKPIALDEQMRLGAQGFERVLELLAELRAPATMFTTGTFACRFPELVRQAHAQGHEIASHGLTHGPLEPGDLLASRTLLEDLIGARVLGFRRARMAPTPPIDIARAGYVYNATLNPTWVPGRYNHLRKPRRPFVERLPGAGPDNQAAELVCIPASVTPLVRFPLFWLAFKNAPPPVFCLASGWVLSSDRELNTYFHPWEFSDLPEMGLPGSIVRHSGLPLLTRLRGLITWLQARGARPITYAGLSERTLKRARTGTGARV